jgi:hypothetical protein
MSNEYPHYDHDCEECVFLGNFIHHGQVVDLYVCEANIFNQKEFIARESSQPSDYACTSFSKNEAIKFNRMLDLPNGREDCALLYGWTTKHCILRYVYSQFGMKGINELAIK